MSLAQLAVGSLLYRPTVLLLTGVMAAILAAVILNIHRLVLRQERWSRYFGWAFGVFGIQYLVQAACSWAGSQGFFSNWKQALFWIQCIAHVLGSTSNTLLFLAAALALLGRLKEGKFLPLWAWAGAVVAATVELIGPSTWYLRLPDALLSAICLILLGWALFVNFKQKNANLALLNLYGAWLYALLHVAYIFNPLLAASNSWPELTNQLRKFGFQVNSAAALLEHRMSAMDTLVFAIAFLFKLGLFLGGLLLIIKMLLILSPSIARGLFENLASNRKNPEIEEVARALGESVEADLSVLWIRWPGAREGLMGGQVWCRREEVMSTRPSPNLAREVIFQSHSAMERVVPFTESDPGTAIVVMPIRFHGAVIGCLQLQWLKRPGYTSTALQRIRQMADWLSPLIHEVRQGMAINRISFDLHAVEEIGAELENLKQALEKLVPVVHRTLLPLATGCVIDLGFVRCWVVCDDRRVESGDEGLDDAQSIEEKTMSAAGPSENGYELSRIDLKVHGTRIGELILAIKRDNDPLTRPSLTANTIHLETVASLLAEAIIDTAHAEFGAILAALQMKLNLVPGNTAQSWFRATEAASLKVGIQWVVASLPQGGGCLLGGRGIELVRSLEVAHQGESDWENGLIVSLPLESEFEGAFHLLVLSLPDSGVRLWLGIGRAMGQELDFPSPWRRFLESLTQATDSALARIERHRLQLEAKQLENVAMRVEMAALLMHTLGNQATALLHGTERLEEMMPTVGAPVTEELQRKTEGIKRLAQSFQEDLAKALHPVPLDERSRVRLRDATEKIRALYEHSFRNKGIELVIDVPPDLFVSVPLNVAYVALVMLTVNASEAMFGGGGSIKISAYNGGGKVCCKVEDNGPGISEEVAAQIFDLGFSTRTEGTGLGLPLARNSLWRYKGNLELTSRQPGATSFTVHFPT
jgi:signal transduction histidine kinase